MTAQLCSRLVRYKQWADSGLNEVVAANLDKVDARDGAILLRILDHIHAVDRIFQHHLLELPHSFAAPRSEAAPAFRELARGMKELDDWYVSYVDALPEDDFEQPIDFVFTSGRPARMRVTRSFCMYACTALIIGAMPESFSRGTASRPMTTG